MTAESYKAYLTEHLTMLEELSKEKDIYCSGNLEIPLKIIELKLETADKLYRLERDTSPPERIESIALNRSFTEMLNETQ